MAEAESSMSRDESIERLGKMIKGIRVAMLTTLDPDGVLRSRPMATQEADFDGTLWFFTKKSTGKVHSIENDQHVNLAYSKPDDQNYVSVAGTATIVEDRAKIHELWTPAMKAWFSEGVDDPEITLIRVDVDSAEIWDSPSSPVVHLIGMAKSIITGRSMDEGKQPERVTLNH